MVTTAFKLGYRDGYANRKPLSQAPEYRNGYAAGQDERLHEQHYWADEATLQAWGAQR